MGGSPQNTSGSVLGSSPMFANLYGQTNKQAPAQPTGTAAFGQGLAQYGHQLSAQGQNEAVGGQPTDDGSGMMRGLTNFGGAAINRFAPHNNVARPPVGPNLFQGYRPEMPSFGGGQTAEGGGIGAQPISDMRRRIGVPMPVQQTPAVPLPMQNLNTPQANATPTLFGGN